MNMIIDMLVSDVFYRYMVNPYLEDLSYQFLLMVLWDNS